MAGILIQFLFLVFLVVIRADAAFGQPRPKVVVSYASMSSVVTTLWVAQERGFFAKNNIDVQTVVPDVNRYTQHRRCSVRLHWRYGDSGGSRGRPGSKNNRGFF